MDALWSLQALLLVALELAAFGVQVFAFVDALRQRPDAYTAAGKLTKRLWLLITGIAFAVGIIFVINQLQAPAYMGYVFHPINIVALVAAGVYLADVRPAIRSITGGGGSSGPYGGW